MIRYTHNKTERHPAVDFPGRSHWPDDQGYSLQVMRLFLSSPPFLDGVRRTCSTGRHTFPLQSENKVESNASSIRRIRRPESYRLFLSHQKQMYFHQFFALQSLFPTKIRCIVTVG
jgi:hypothetical protein